MVLEGYTWNEFNWRHSIKSYIKTQGYTMLGKYQGQTKTCKHCEGIGHQRAQCPILNKAKERQSTEPIKETPININNTTSSNNQENPMSQTSNTSSVSNDDNLEQQTTEKNVLQNHRETKSIRC